MCCTNDLVECPIDRPNTGNQHKTFPLAKGDKRKSNSLSLCLGFSFLRNHDALDGLPGLSCSTDTFMTPNLITECLREQAEAA